MTIKNIPAQICSKDAAVDSSALGKISGYASIMPESIKKTQLKTISFRKDLGYKSIVLKNFRKCSYLKRD